MNPTPIEWVKNPDGTQGYTWNPITGCLNGCSYCYARKLANGRLKQRYLANRDAAPYRSEQDYMQNKDNPFHPRYWHEKLCAIPGGKPKGIFTCDMSDLFGIGIPGEWQARVFAQIRRYSQHRFYLLTKQPQNLPKFSPFPDNCWVGVTATDTRMALEACLKLGDIKAPIKYLSLEPMLNSINLPPEHLKVCGINQLIIGSMTCGGGEVSKVAAQFPQLTLMPYGNRYTLQPRIEWVEEIARAADRAGIPVFLKDNLKPLFATATTYTDKWVFSKKLGYGELYKQEMPR